MDAIPVFSQLKSAVQWTFRDAEGARQTQINFSRLCPVVSQVRSIVEASRGDKKAAKETQIQFGFFMLSIVDGIPVIGHIKGTVHYILGDKEAGGAAMKAASHTSAVIGGGAVGFLVGGPGGAFGLGAGAGVAIDSIITATDSAINKILKPYGVFELYTDPTNPGKWCDAAGGIVFDGMVGMCAGEVVRQIKLNILKPAANLNNILDTVTERRVIPRPITISDPAKIVVKNLAGKSAGQFMKNAGKPAGQFMKDAGKPAGQFIKNAGKTAEQFIKNVKKKVLLMAQNLGRKRCKLEVNKREVVPVEEALANTFGASVKLKGNALEVYQEGKLILLHSGNSAYYVNDNRGMLQVKNGITGDLCCNGKYLESDLGCESMEVVEPQMSTVEHEEASVGCFGREHDFKTIGELIYDYQQNKISSGPCRQNIDIEEEHQSFSITFAKCGAHMVLP